MSDFDLLKKDFLVKLNQNSLNMSETIEWHMRHPLLRIVIYNREENIKMILDSNISDLIGDK